MRTTSTTSSTIRPRRASMHRTVPLIALALALAGCAGGEPAAEPDPSQQETTVQSTPEQSGVPTASPSPSPSRSTTPPGAAPTPSSDVAGTNALLTVAIAQDASAEPVQYTLECVDGTPGAATTLPNADAACAALARLGAEFFTARPNKDVVCTQQYGGPQTASITGDLDGTSIIATFALTDGCEISRWNSVADIIGAGGA